MADEIPDLWPEDFGDTTVATPLSVLRIQAKALAARTVQASGRSNTARNLQLLCEPCNRRKGASLA